MVQSSTGNGAPMGADPGGLGRLRLEAQFGFGAGRVLLCPDGGRRTGLGSLRDGIALVALEVAGWRPRAGLAVECLPALVVLVLIGLLVTREPPSRPALRLVRFEPVAEVTPEPEPPVAVPPPAPESPPEPQRPAPMPPIPRMPEAPRPEPAVRAARVAPAPRTPPPAPVPRRPAPVPAPAALAPEPPVPTPAPRRVHVVARPSPVGPKPLPEIQAPAALEADRPRALPANPVRHRALAPARTEPRVAVDPVALPRVASLPAREASPPVVRSARTQPTAPARRRPARPPAVPIPAAPARSQTTAPPALPAARAPRPTPAPRGRVPSVTVAPWTPVPAAESPAAASPAEVPVRTEAHRVTSAASRDSASAPELRGVPLGALAACVSDQEEDRLKLRLMAAVTGQEDCVSRAGRYRFVETKNLNAFLMWVERARPRPDADRCVELQLAIECLGQASGVRGG